MVKAGFEVLEHDDRVAAWAGAARRAAQGLDLTPDRLDQTWHVGVNALPNGPDGSIDGVALVGPWDVSSNYWHRAQLSVVYPGFPGRDPKESDKAHSFRIKRFGAHIDGLLPQGPQRRRFLREPHAFVLGVPLNNVTASSLMVWPGGHLTLRKAFTTAFAGVNPNEWTHLDLTDVYHAARREVFHTITPEPVHMQVGQAVLLDRHMLHGVAPWNSKETEPRMIAYFRPEFAKVTDWCSGG